MAIDFVRLTARQIHELPRLKTVFFFPVGPLEDHGPHLPVGLDLSEADQLARLTAERMEKEMPGWIGIIMPAVAMGVSSNTSALAITIRGYVLRDWLIDSCRSLIRADFRHFVCFTGQLGPRQLTAIEEAGRGVMWMGPLFPLRRLLARKGTPAKTRPTFASACSALVKMSDAKRSPFWSDPEEHGEQRDTSVALALGWMNRQPLSSTTVSTLGLGAQPVTESYWKRGLRLWLGKRQGYWGKTSAADGRSQEGDLILHSSVDEIYPKLRAVWEGTNPNSLFRTWYSVLPPNKSFFKAWILAIMVLATLFAWLMISVQGIFHPVR